MLSHELLENIKNLELRTRRLVDSFMVGEYFSVFKGRGLEFYEMREYQYGDDIRAIDWKTTARTDKPFVKVSVEERELPVMFLADMSGSIDFGSMGRLKKDLMLEVIAFLGIAAIKRNNPVGLIGFAERVQIFHAVKKGRKNLLSILAGLMSAKYSSRTDIRVGIDALYHAAIKKGLVFLLSDFMDIDYELALKTAAKKYDIVPVVLTDPFEETLPDAGFIDIKDSETGMEMVVDSTDKRFRDWFHNNTNKQKRERQRIFSDAGLAYIEVRTDMTWTKPIRDFFYRRQGARS
ncbi:MAG: DUF58 domain-containing protein [Deltaproteobacteria bacterium]|nr:DUF58 domain-containing protein [Deltaproteobacteria bacterium]